MKKQIKPPTPQNHEAHSFFSNQIKSSYEFLSSYSSYNSKPEVNEDDKEFLKYEDFFKK